SGAGSIGPAWAVRVPELDGPVAAPRRQGRPIRRDRDAPDPIGMAEQPTEELPRGRIPELELRGAFRGGGHAISGQEGDRRDALVMLGVPEAVVQFAGGEVPDAQETIVTSRGEPAAVRREGEVIDRSSPDEKTLAEAQIREVPDPGKSIPACGGQS